MPSRAGERRPSPTTPSPIRRWRPTQPVRPGRPVSVAGTSARNGTSARTPVLDPQPGTVIEPAFRLVDPSINGNGPGAVPPIASSWRRAMPVSSGIDPMLTALRASAAASAEAALR
jgi:hypothetical protein